MAKEIERRFLVHPDRLPRLVRGKKIIQGYLSTDPIVRVRIRGKKSYLAIKFGETAKRDEFEFKIPVKDGKDLFEKCKVKIEKTRYYFRLNGKIWEIDVFEGRNKGLIIAEIELSSLRSKFKKPLWLSSEVTDNPRYLNVNLALRPYGSWK